MRRFWLALLLASVAAQVFAQQVPDTGPVDEREIAPVRSTAPPLPLQVQAPTQRSQPFTRVLYVLDVSGSMTSQLDDAIAVTDIFCSDGFKAAVVTFNDSHQCWSGVPTPCKHPKDQECGDKCLEPGWAWMPRHRTEMLRYLASFAGHGMTDPTSALDYAIKNAPTGTLIVFISDGDFPHQDMGQRAGPVSAVRNAQAWRKDQKLAPVQILVWATSEMDSKRESLVELAKLGGCGLWRADTRQTGPW